MRTPALCARLSPLSVSIMTLSHALYLNLPYAARRAHRIIIHEHQCDGRDKRENATAGGA